MGDEDDALMAVSSEQQREAVTTALSAAEDWLYVDGADEGASAYRQAICQARAVVERSPVMIIDRV